MSDPIWRFVSPPGRSAETGNGSKPVRLPACRRAATPGKPREPAFERNRRALSFRLPRADAFRRGRLASPRQAGGEPSGLDGTADFPSDNPERGSALTKSTVLSHSGRSVADTQRLRA